MLPLPAVIKHDRLMKIIEEQKPLGSFISYQRDIWMAVDNRKGKVHTKDFDTFYEALDWLK